jgi:hypothetical protein
MDDNDRLTREEILAAYGWQPGEKEQLEREMAERQVRIDAEARDEMLRWCEARAIAERQRPALEKTAAECRLEAAAAVKVWESYVQNKINDAIAMIGKETSRFVSKELNADVEARKQGDEELREALDNQDRRRKQDKEELKGIIFDNQHRFKDHPTHEVIWALRRQIDTLQAQNNEMRQRIERLEAAPVPLRAVS